MILFSILLSSGLDMTLPEFEPDIDLSGNYIVSEYDVSSGEFIGVEVPAEELPDIGGFRSEAPAESFDVVTAIETMNDDNNRYWEMFLDSYYVEVSHSGVGSVLHPSPFKFSSNGTTSSGGDNDWLCYFPVQIGLTYTISDISSIPSNFVYRYGVVDDYNNPTSVLNFGSQNDNSSITFTANQTGYFCLWRVSSNSFDFHFNVSWITQEPESYTLSELGNAVMEIKDNNDMKFRILIFLTLMNFAYPIVISSFKNFFGGGKNV